MKPDFKKTLPRASVQILAVDGSVLLGSHFEYLNHALKLHSAADLQTKFLIPTTQIRSIRSSNDSSFETIAKKQPNAKTHRDVLAEPENAPITEPLLQIRGLSLSGDLAPMPAANPTAMLRFAPKLAENAVGIRETAKGTIKFPRPAQKTQA